VAGYNAKIADLEAENREQTKWALDIESRLTEHVRQVSADLVTALAALAHTEEELNDRTTWALRLDEEKRLLEDQLTLVRSSRWIKLGRKVGIGPAVPPCCSRTFSASCADLGYNLPSPPTRTRSPS
jgi:hypothetical protein